MVLGDLWDQLMKESMKIFSTVRYAMRTYFRKCGFRRLVHEGIHILQVTEFESSRVLEIFNEDGDSNVVLLQIEEKNSK